jgi:hypothetical protein
MRLDSRPPDAHLVRMSDDKPNPLEDVRKGLGLLFRAAKRTVEKLPTKDIEEVVVTSAREVGRALENVGKTIEREVLGKKDEPKTRVSTQESKTEEEKKDGSDDPKPPPDAA